MSSGEQVALYNVIRPSKSFVDKHAFISPHTKTASIPLFVSFKTC